MSNPNRCETCKHRQVNPDGGWCYMFKVEPEEICHQHTSFQVAVVGDRRSMLWQALRILAMENPHDHTKP